MLYLLDTDTCSYFLRDRYDLRARFREVGAENLTVSRITYAELMTLAIRRKSKHVTRKTARRQRDRPRRNHRDAQPKAL